MSLFVKTILFFLVTKLGSAPSHQGRSEGRLNSAMHIDQRDFVFITQNYPSLACRQSGPTDVSLPQIPYRHFVSNISHVFLVCKAIGSRRYEPEVVAFLIIANKAPLQVQARTFESRNVDWI